MGASTVWRWKRFVAIGPVPFSPPWLMPLPTTTNRPSKAKVVVRKVKLSVWLGLRSGSCWKANPNTPISPSRLAAAV